MDLLELEQKQKLSREAAAEKLRALADALSRHNSVEFVKNGQRIPVDVADEVEMSVEIEVGDDKELEIEIKW